MSINVNGPVRTKVKHWKAFGRKEARPKAFVFEMTVPINKRKLQKKVNLMPVSVRSIFQRYLSYYKDGLSEITLYIFKYNLTAIAAAVRDDLQWRNLRPGNYLDLGLLPLEHPRLRRRIVIAPEPLNVSGGHSLQFESCPAMSFEEGEPRIETVDTIATSPQNRKFFCYLALKWAE